MELANDMRNLRHAIDQMRAARGEMIDNLHGFAANLSDSVGHAIAQMHQSFVQESARARMERGAFVAHNRRMVGEMVAMFGAERAAARRNFFGKSA